MVESYLGKSIAITGGSSGIGYAIAERLASEGAKLFIITRDVSKSGELTERLQARHPACRVTVVDCDISDRKQVLAAAKIVGEQTEAVDLLINNAGYATFELFIDIAYDQAVDLAQTNFTGHVAVTSAFLPLVHRAGAGHICFITSVAAELPITPNSVYAASKRGMEGIAIALGHELRFEGISVSSVFPGRIVTPFFDHPTFQTRVAGRETRLTTPIDIAGDQIVAGLRKRRKRIFVPWYWRVIVYLFKVDPLIFGRVFEAALSRRISSLRSTNAARGK